jgi:hypothetical protein
MPIRSTFDLTHSNRELVELTPMLMKARNKRSLNLPLFKVDHTRLALDFREVESWQLPKNLVNQRVVLLVRDPRDVMVSNWFEKKYRKVSLARFGESFSPTLTPLNTRQFLSSLCAHRLPLYVYF